MFTTKEIKKAKESVYSLIKLKGGGVWRGIIERMGKKQLSGMFYRCHASGAAIAPAVWHTMTFKSTEVASIES